MEQFLDSKIEHGEALTSLRKISQQQREGNQGAIVVDLKRKKRVSFMIAASIAFFISFCGYFVFRHLQF